MKFVKIWYCWLKHLNINNIKNIQQIILRVRFHKFTKTEKKTVCKTCVQEKQIKKQIFKKWWCQLKKFFDLIYSDICDLFSIFKNKSHYFIIFMNDFICYVWVKVLSTKNEVINVFMQFYLEIKTQFDVKIKQVWSDNEGEYSDQLFQTFMNSKTIFWELIIVYNLFENEVSECQNWTLMNYICMIFTDSDLSISLWSELLETAVYLQNQSSTKHLKRKTSYEALFDKKPDLSNLRIISCQAWALISKKKHLKFDLRFSDCRLLEYAASMQYILYEMNSDWVIFSHDVIFNESSKAEADHSLPDWIFDFNLSDELLQSICLYTQKSLFSEANIESFSASHVIDHVEASTVKSSASLSAKMLAKLLKSSKFDEPGTSNQPIKNK